MFCSWLCCWANTAIPEFTCGVEGLVRVLNAKEVAPGLQNVALTTKNPMSMFTDTLVDTPYGNINRPWLPSDVSNHILSFVANTESLATRDALNAMSVGSVVQQEARPAAELKGGAAKFVERVSNNIKTGHSFL